MASFRTGPLYVPGPGRSGIQNPVVDPNNSNSGYDYGWAQPYTQPEKTETTPTNRGSMSFLPSQYQPRTTTSTTTGTTTGTRTGTTTPIAPNIPLPEFTLPEWSEGRMRELRRRYMAPVRSLRQGLRRTLASMPSATNVAVAREMGRGAVEGFGTGLSEISTAAGREALAEYRAERAEEVGAAQMNFQAAMQDYMARWGSKTTQTTTETTTGTTTGTSGYAAPTNASSSRPRRSMGAWGWEYF